jgi:hypothetical protein
MLIRADGSAYGEQIAALSTGWIGSWSGLRRVLSHDFLQHILFDKSLDSVLIAQGRELLTYNV